jgi:hypothetical protein
MSESQTPDPVNHLAALTLVSTALDRERAESDHWRREAQRLCEQQAEDKRWEYGMRRIARLFGIGDAGEWEIADVVERVRDLAEREPTP